MIVRNPQSTWNSRKFWLDTESFMKQTVKRDKVKMFKISVGRFSAEKTDRERSQSQNTYPLYMHI